jgi:hypothetical protein
VVPHSPQKRSPGSLADPQFGHRSANGAPQFEQNFRPGRFSVPQALHFSIQLIMAFNCSACSR